MVRLGLIEINKNEKNSVLQRKNHLKYIDEKYTVR